MVHLYPRELYTRVDSLENVASLPLWGGGLVATQNDLPGQATFVFTNDAPAPQRLDVYLGFADTGAGNRLSAAYAFDGEPWHEAFVLDQPLGDGDAAFHIDRRAPYRRLRLRFTLLCASRTPMYPGGNLESLRLKDFQIHAAALETPPTP